MNQIPQNLELIASITGPILLAMIALFAWVRADNRSLRQEMDKRYSELRQETNRRYSELRQEMDKRHSELRQEMDKRHSELRQEMDKRHSELKQEIAGLRADVSSLAGRMARVEGQLEFLRDYITGRNRQMAAEGD